MPDENRCACADLSQEILQRVGKGCDADVHKRRRTAIARHVPGDGAKNPAKELDLAAPSSRCAAYPMQEYQGRPAGIAGGLIAETAITALHRCRYGHAGLRLLKSAAMLAGGSAMGSDNFRPKTSGFASTGAASRGKRLHRDKPGNPAPLVQTISCWLIGSAFPKKSRVHNSFESRTSGVGLFRQKIHLVLGGEPDDLSHIGQFMEPVEQRFQLAGRRNPEQGTDRLV